MTLHVSLPCPGTDFKPKTNGSGIAKVRRAFDDKVIEYVLKPKHLQALQNTHKELVAKVHEVKAARDAEPKEEGTFRKAARAAGNVVSSITESKSVRTARKDREGRQNLLGGDEE